MAKYVAFLRGINVGGVRIKMGKLVPLIESIGYKNVKTYLQSGNIIFSSKSKNIVVHQTKIAAAIKKKFGYDIAVMVRTQAEINKAIKDNPFHPDIGGEATTLHVVFMSHKLDKGSADFLKGLSVPEERIDVVGDRTYVLLKRFNFPKSSLGKNVIEKKLKVTATTRNWNTVNSVFDIMS